MKKNLFSTLAALCLLFVFHAPSFAAEADDAVAKIQAAYEKIKDIKGSFVQKSYIKDLKRTDTYKGQFFIKSKKMKWEYRGEKPQTVYVSGEDILIYQKNEKQAFRAKFDRATYGQAPIALLGGMGDIRKEFDVSMKADGRLLLKPKKTMGNIAYVELVPRDDEFPVESFVIVDVLSNRIDLQLKDVRINTGLNDKIFEFSPPEGTSLIQQ